MVHLDYRDARPIYMQIIDGFRNQIQVGILQKGDKMPSVRELASTLAINPNTIQRAYRELEAEGWIVSVSGKGSFVNGTTEEQRQELVPLWDDLDKAASALLRAGVPMQTLLQHLKQGDDRNA